MSCQFCTLVSARCLPITTVQKQSSITSPDARYFSPLISGFDMVVLVPALVLQFRAHVGIRRIGPRQTSVAFLCSFGRKLTVCVDFFKTYESCDFRCPLKPTVVLSTESEGKSLAEFMKVGGSPIQANLKQHTRGASHTAHAVALALSLVPMLPNRSQP